MKKAVGFVVLILSVALVVFVFGKSRNVLFEDDFSDPESGWDRVVDSSSITDYQDGQYRILAGLTGYEFLATPGMDIIDVFIEVEATRIGGPENSGFGVVCRYTNPLNFIAFLITGEGNYAIYKVLEGEQTTLAGGTDGAIKLGEQSNLIRAECVGNVYTLIVNGTHINQAIDFGFVNGDVGLIARTFDAPGADILFDDFTVLEPPPIE